MTDSEKNKCHTIIHSCAAGAAGAAGGNIVPIPGVGIAADIIAMTAMTMSLAGVFGGNLTEQAAKGIAIAAIKRTMLKQPIRVIAKELSKLIPGLGQIVAPTISVIMVEAAGWAIAKDLERQFSK